MLEDVGLQHTDSTTYLRVTFDKRQTWRYHINCAQAKARRKLALLRKLVGTQWGAAETECLHRGHAPTSRIWINIVFFTIHA